MFGKKEMLLMQIKTYQRAHRIKLEIRILKRDEDGFTLTSAGVLIAVFDGWIERSKRIFIAANAALAFP